MGDNKTIYYRWHDAPMFILEFWLLLMVMWVPYGIAIPIIRQYVNTNASLATKVFIWWIVISTIISLINSIMSLRRRMKKRKAREETALPG